MTNSAPPAVASSAFIIAGPTGSGKSEIALELAERCGGEIVGADAFQVYAGLPLLTAQPPAEWQARVPHHLIAEIPLTESFHVGRYLELAAARLAEIRERGRIPIVTGGTGLYLRALQRGLAQLPAAHPAIRAELENLSSEQRIERLRRLDPAAASWLDLRNPRRIIRALEVCQLTGRPFSSFRHEWSAAEPVMPAGVTIKRDKEALRARISARVTEMFRAGVTDEVAAAGEIGPTAAQCLGFRAIQRLLRQEMSQHDCASLIERETWHYAKRQMTWGRRESSLLPLRGGIEEIWTRRSELNLK